MIGDLFDSPWKIAIIAILIIVLFGARKLPVAARELGRSMRILKKEVSSLHNDDDLDATEISVAVADSEATLSGTVNSRAEKRRAEDLADDVPGISHVQNNLRVKSAPK